MSLCKQANTKRRKEARTIINTLNDIRTHDPGIPAAEDRMRLYTALPLASAARLLETTIIRN
jgi:hypothetical protein